MGLTLADMIAQNFGVPSPGAVNDKLRSFFGNVFTGNGSPEGVVTSPVGGFYFDLTNGAMYAKQSGAGNTGWIAGASTWQKTVFKATDQTVNNSTALQNDTALTFPVGANEVWVAQMNLFIVGDPTADIKLAVTVPVGASFMAGGMGIRSSDLVITSSQVTTVSGTPLPTIFGADTVGNIARVVVFISNGTTPGSVTLQWAQSAATVANTTVKAGSWIDARRIS